MIEGKGEAVRQSLATRSVVPDQERQATRDDRHLVAKALPGSLSIAESAVKGLVGLVTVP